MQKGKGIVVLFITTDFTLNIASVLISDYLKWINNDFSFWRTHTDERKVRWRGSVLLKVLQYLSVFVTD